MSVAARIEEHKAGYTTDYARDVRIENFYKSGGKDCSESLNATTGSNVLTCNDGAVSFTPQNYDIVARKRIVSRPEVKLRFDATGYTGEYYTIPMVYLSHDDKPIATGSAAKRCTDDPSDPNDGVMNIDDPCNWNKVSPGDIVAIPLYYEDENGNVVNPA
ncbi:MAG: hypothetical protein AAB592_05765, partial [Patescibacteria group bacterium]